MLTTIEGVYKKGSIELSEDPIGLEEARVLVTFLPAAHPSSQPKDLYGAWKASMPAMFDVEEMLQEIRQESAKRIEIDSNE